jgi:hypothetical protein
MMLDPSTRQLIAYGLIALLTLAAVAALLWRRHNSPARRYQRNRMRRAAYRLRQPPLLPATGDERVRS